MPAPFHREPISTTPRKQAGKGQARSSRSQGIREGFLFTYLVRFKGKGGHINKEEKENPCGLIGIPGKFP